ncbi:MAG: phosphate ABC transporter substrate-binding protein, PhoT family [Bacteroidia bacterium]|nr:MAG: phosphate ABC transporter substrate-binding protein, PhoT family [Bacteroidia bacterium]
MKNLNYISFLLVLFYFSCTPRNEKNVQPDTRDSGLIHIVADESYKPIIDEEIKVFESNSYGKATILVQYKPEEELVKDLWNDSIRLIFSTLQIPQGLAKKIEDSLNTNVSQLKIARDAVAVIVNPNNPKSKFTMAEIKNLLSNDYNGNLFPVFDGLKATSTVKYIVDSVLKGKKLSSKAVAARSSDSVVHYVAQNPNAVGFVGVSWVGNKDDKEQLSFLKKVKIASIESNYSPGLYILPVQEHLYTSSYPMTRDLTYILKERYAGLGNGFADFVSGQIGQLIFKRAYLMPGRNNFIIRPARLNE